MSDYVAGESINQNEVIPRLEAAALDAGLSFSEVQKTIESAMGRGDGSKAWYPSESVAVRQSMPWRGRVVPIATPQHSGNTPTVPLDADHVRMTWYRSITEVQGRGECLTWDELTLAVMEPADADSPVLPLWSGHEIENDSRSQIPDGIDNKGREKFRAPTVAAVHVLILDYDDDEAFTRENVSRWWGDVQYVAHTTRHHMAAKGPKPAIARGRVIVSISRPITSEELVTIAAWVLSASKGSPAEKELKTAARAYFEPVLTADYWSASNLCARSLDVDAILTEQKQEEEAALPSASVMGLLEQSKDGHPLSSPTNLDTILEHDSRFTGRFHACVFSYRILVDDKALTDVMETEIALKIGRLYGLHYSEERIHRAIGAVASRRPRHPVRDYLDSLTWDGRSRVDKWLSDYAGCDDTDGLCGPMGRRFLVSCVARVYEPGCKVDTVLILAGKQGYKKSSAFSVLAGEQWFSDTALNFNDKDAYQQLSGVFLYEVGELDSIKRSEATAVKAFLSSRTDKFRPSYGRNIVANPRQCVFVGTTNDESFLTDSTGSRRFWARKVSRKIELSELAKVRDQLWAEAVHLYRAREQWWLTEEEDEARELSAREFEQSDPWEDLIYRWAIQRSGPWTVRTLLVEAIGLENREINMGHAIKLGKTLARLGWSKVRSNSGAREWLWMPPRA